MKRPLRIIAIFIFSIMLIVLAGETAIARNAVVVYVDVSGSMFWDEHKVTSVADPAKQITLMKGAVEVLRNLFLEENALIKNGDYLLIKGFFSRVGNIFGPVDSYDRSQHSGELIDKLTDLNRKSIQADTRFRLSPRYEGDKAPDRTNFETLLSDMDTTLYDTIMDSRFQQTVCIILTDGGHYGSGKKQFRQAISNSRLAQPAIKKNKKSRLLLYTFGSELKKNEYDVRPDFRNYLNAESFDIYGNKNGLSSVEQTIRETFMPLSEVKFAGVIFPHEFTHDVGQQNIGFKFTIQDDNIESVIMRMEAEPFIDNKIGRAHV